MKGLLASLAALCLVAGGCTPDVDLEATSRGLEPETTTSVVAPPDRLVALDLRLPPPERVEAPLSGLGRGCTPDFCREGSVAQTQYADYRWNEKRGVLGHLLEIADPGGYGCTCKWGTGGCTVGANQTPNVVCLTFPSGRGAMFAGLLVETRIEVFPALSVPDWPIGETLVGRFYFGDARDTGEPIHADIVIGEIGGQSSVVTGRWTCNDIGVGAYASGERVEPEGCLLAATNIHGGPSTPLSEVLYLMVPGRALHLVATIEAGNISVGDALAEVDPEHPLAQCAKDDECRARELASVAYGASLVSRINGSANSEPTQDLTDGNYLSASLVTFPWLPPDGTPGLVLVVEEECPVCEAAYASLILEDNPIPIRVAYRDHHPAFVGAPKPPFVLVYDNRSVEGPLPVPTQASFDEPEAGGGRVHIGVVPGWAAATLQNACEKFASLCTPP